MHKQTKSRRQGPAILVAAQVSLATLRASARVRSSQAHSGEEGIGKNDYLCFIIDGEFPST
jgi:hypothetical protein